MRNKFDATLVGIKQHLSHLNGRDESYTLYYCVIRWSVLLGIRFRTRCSRSTASPPFWCLCLRSEEHGIHHRHQILHISHFSSSSHPCNQKTKLDIEFTFLFSGKNEIMNTYGMWLLMPLMNLAMLLRLSGQTTRLLEGSAVVRSVIMLSPSSCSRFFR